MTAPDLDAAIAHARVLVGLDAAESPTPQSPAVWQAFGDALKTARRGPKSTADWHYYVLRFLEWLKTRHPACQTWEQITRPILREYLATLDGKSDTMRRLAFQPIRQTARYIRREYDLPDRTEGLQHGQSPQSPTAEVYLADVLDLLTWVAALPVDGVVWQAGRRQARRRITRETLRAGIALQALAGLRLQEATRLTWDRVDLDRGLLEISGEVKTAGSERVFPICGVVVEALRAALTPETGRVRTIHRPVLRTTSDRGYGQNWRAYSTGLGVALRQWNPRAGWKPKDLRNCLTTWAATNGYGGEIWEQYVGRAPRSVAARHYIPRLASRTRGESEELDRAMGVFRRLVVEPLENAIRAAENPQKKIVEIAPDA